MSSNQPAVPETSNQSENETQPVAESPHTPRPDKGVTEGEGRPTPVEAATTAAVPKAESAEHEPGGTGAALQSSPPPGPVSPSDEPHRGASATSSPAPAPNPLGAALTTEAQKEFQANLITFAFHSDVFVVSKGEKTDDMKEVEAKKAAAAEKARADAGQPATPRKPVPQPDLPQVAVLERLAGTLKIFVDGDARVDSSTKASFKMHFAGTSLEQYCDSAWDAAVAHDVTFGELKKLGVHRAAMPVGLPATATLARRITAQAAAQAIPNGDLSNNFISTLTLLRLDKYLTGGGQIEWNVMSGNIELNRVEVDEAELYGAVFEELGTNYVVRTGRGRTQMEPAKGTLEQALSFEAMRHRYHPTREWFEGIRGTWDGEDHLGKVIELINGVKKVPKDAEPDEVERLERFNRLAVTQLRHFFLGLVARTYKPGEKVDTMLVLKGAQGIKKSTFFQRIAPAGRFSSSPLIMGDKDSMLMMQRFSLVELAEMNNMSKQAVGDIKAFVAQPSDDFRVPYGKRVTSFPRHCVLCSTTNDSTFLRDPTGSRRFEVIEVFGVCDLKAVAALKEQLWAQAVHLYFEADTCADCKASRDGEDRCAKHRWWLTGSQVTDRAEVNENFNVELPYSDWLKCFFKAVQNGEYKDKPGMHSSGEKWAKADLDELKVADLVAEADGAQFRNDAKRCRDMAAALRALKYSPTDSNARGMVWRSPSWTKPPRMVPQASPLATVTNLAEAPASKPKPDVSPTPRAVVETPDGDAERIKRAHVVNEMRRARKAAKLALEQAAAYPEWEEAHAAAQQAVAEAATWEQRARDIVESADARRRQKELMAKVSAEKVLSSRSQEPDATADTAAAASKK